MRNGCSLRFQKISVPDLVGASAVDGLDAVFSAPSVVLRTMLAIRVQKCSY